MTWSGLWVGQGAFEVSRLRATRIEERVRHSLSASIGPYIVGALLDYAVQTCSPVNSIRIRYSNIAGGSDGSSPVRTEGDGGLAR